MDEWAKLAHPLLYYRAIALVPGFSVQRVDLLSIYCTFYVILIFIIEMFMSSNMNNVNNIKLQLIKQFQ